MKKFYLSLMALLVAFVIQSCDDEGNLTVDPGSLIVPEEMKSGMLDYMGKLYKIEGVEYEYFDKYKGHSMIFLLEGGNNVALTIADAQTNKIIDLTKTTDDLGFTFDAIIDNVNNDVEITTSTLGEGPVLPQEGNARVIEIEKGKSYEVYFTYKKGNMKAPIRLYYKGEMNGPNIGGEEEREEYVDLGLPSGTMWGTCNLGANQPDEPGAYFAWGDTIFGERFAETNYKFFDPTTGQYSKYVIQGNKGNVDNLYSLLPKDDAARAALGNEWHLPTRQQCQELFNPDYTSVRRQGNTLIITSNHTGKSITLPIQGYKNDTQVEDQESMYIWTNEVVASDSRTAYTYQYGRLGAISTMERYCGLPIRPVFTPIPSDPADNIPESTPFTVKFNSKGTIVWNAIGPRNYTEESYERAEVNLLYSIDNGATWEKYNGEAIERNSRETVMFKAGTPSDPSVTNTAMRSEKNDTYLHFETSAMVEIYGNILYLLNGQNPGRMLPQSEYGHEFANLFQDNLRLISAENLLMPKNMNKYTCTSMFYGCVYMTTAPAQLPARELANSCYSSMFNGCTFLTKVPVLPARYVSEWAYNQMFHKCYHLATVKTYFTSYGYYAIDEFLTSAGTQAEGEKPIWYVPVQMLSDEGVNKAKGYGFHLQGM